MEDRVRRLYSDNLQCGDEVETIKNIYMYDKLLNSF